MLRPISDQNRPANCLKPGTETSTPAATSMVSGKVTSFFSGKEESGSDASAWEWGEPKGAGERRALLLDVYGELTPKEKCTCRVRAHGGGWRDTACAEVASRAGATVDGQYSSYNFEQWVNGDGG